MKKVSLTETFSKFSEAWSPKIIGEVNGMHVKAAKLMGEFMWHHHDLEDEMFLVVSGNLLMRFRDRDVHVGPGEFIIVPHGTEHLPVAPEGCEVLLIEPKGTLNTGNVRNERTIEELGIL